MSKLKVFRYSLQHVVIAMLLSSTAFLSKPDGWKWMLVFWAVMSTVSFSAEYMLYRYTKNHEEDAKRKLYGIFIMLQGVVSVILFFSFLTLMNRSL
ncbi:hypothetical protein [Bacillus sp. 179-C3.3 HS]|uniref:hypothetical protein n=1 Tax=Bacillus sp. 179-C3.3 HS TaxID=3232162 RepID=UPI0039A19C10